MKNQNQARRFQVKSLSLTVVINQSSYQYYFINLPENFFPFKKNQKLFVNYDTMSFFIFVLIIDFSL